MQVERGRRGDIIARIYDKAAPSARALRSALNAGSSAMRPSHSLLTAKVERYALQGRAGVGTTPPFFDAMSTGAAAAAVVRPQRDWMATSAGQPAPTPKTFTSSLLVIAVGKC